MKILLAIITLLFLISCDKEQDQSLALTVLADRTEPELITNPDLFTVKTLCNLQEFPNREIRFRFQNIGITDFNPVYSASLSSSNVLENTLERKSVVNNFFDVIDTLLTRENGKVYDYKTSSILTPLVNQLHKLKASNASYKVLLLNSDIFEHSKYLNAYSKYDVSRIRKSPTLVANNLRDKLNIEDFSGVTLIINHHPKNIENNERFKIFIALYRELFADTGLNIQIGLDKSLNP